MWSFEGVAWNKYESCKGRLWTKGVTLMATPIPHNHDANFADAEKKKIYSTAKDLIITASSSSPACKKNAANSALLCLPNSDTFRQALNRTKKVENPTPTAPSSLADLQLDPNEIHFFKGEPMLLHDNQDEERRIIIFGTQQNLDKL